MSSQLSERELNRMRSAAERTLGGQAGSAIVKQETVTSDGGGGGSVTVAAAGTFACRLAPMMRHDESEQGARIEAQAEFIATLPTSASVTRADLIEIDGTDYNVVGIRRRSHPVTLRLEVREVV